VVRRRHQQKQAAHQEPRDPKSQQDRDQRRFQHNCLAHEGIHCSASLSSRMQMAGQLPNDRSLKMKDLHLIGDTPGCGQENTLCTIRGAGVSLAPLASGQARRQRHGLALEIR
jgi:hypothetical protein